MKILVLSLLRVGDFIMQESLISSIGDQHPKAELHLLINDVSEKYIRESGKYSHVHVLPRSRLQRFLIEPDRPKLSAYLGLSKLVNELNSLDFDLVINLSHTLFSARLMDLLQSGAQTPQKMQKNGIRFQDGSRWTIDNPWSQYLNEHFTQNSSTSFHSMDLLSKSLKLSSLKNNLSQALPANKRKIKSESPKISLQVLTSDAKKNWPQKNFVELAALILSRFPKAELSILGSPAEEDLIRQNFLSRPGLKIEILNWKDLRQHLENCDLLITGDTSVQHLAAQVGTNLLSLFLGSANPEKTAPQLRGAILLQPRTACAPCSHLGACHQPTHVCAADLSVENVYAVVESQLLQKDFPEIHAQIFKMDTKNNGMFFLKRIGKGAEVINLKRSLEQVVWQIYLDQGHLDVAGPFGSAAYIFIDEYSHALRGPEIQNWLQKRLQEFHLHEIFIDGLELSFRKKISPFLSLGASSSPGQHLRDEVTNHLFGQSSGKDYFFSLLQNLKDLDEGGFAQMKKVKESLEEARALIEIELKLIKSIMTELRERNFVYVSGTRTLSDTRSAAP